VPGNRPSSARHLIADVQGQLAAMEFLVDRENPHKELLAALTEIWLSGLGNWQHVDRNPQV